MKHAYLFISITLWLSILTIITVSCEKPEPDPDPSTQPTEEQVITTADRLVGKWAHDWSYIPNNDTLLFTEEGKCYCIIGNSHSDGSSDTTTCFYDCSEQFLILYKNDLEYSPLPHYIKFYDDYTYFVMYNCPFFNASDVIWNAGFKKVE